MKILITGGGFLGQRIARTLQSQGHSTRLLDVAKSPSVEWDWRTGDVSSLDAAGLPG